MKKTRRLSWILGLSLLVSFNLLVLLGSNSVAIGAEWPDRPITAVVGWSAGGTSDTTVRALAQEMSGVLGVDIKISNMSGANGGISYQNVFQSPNDGYKLFGGAQVQGTYPITKQAKVGIVISEETKKYLNESFKLKELGDVTLKGKSKNIRSYSVSYD